MTANAPDLLALARQGDPEAAARALEQNSGLIWAVVRRYYGRGAEPEDLYQLGCLGFLKAVQGFDSAYGTQFSTYAVPKIAGEIRRYLRDNGAIKVSRGLREQSLAVYEGELLDGYTAIAAHKVGKGKVILLGTMPSNAVLRSLVGLAPIAEASSNVRLVARSGAAEGIIAMETENRAGHVVLEGKYRDLIGGGTLGGKVQIPAYGVLVLQKI